MKTVPRLMSVERKCYYRFAIHRDWEFAVIVEAIFIRIGLFQICRKVVYATGWCCINVFFKKFVSIN